MSRYVMIHRLRGPAVLLLIGVLALLHQMDVLPHFWRLLWPLVLILLGVMMLVERAALSTEGYPMFSGWTGQSPSQNAPNAGEGWRGGWHETSRAAGQGETQAAGTAIVPSQPSELANRGNGEES
jgi:hypothetical protein